MEYRTWEIPPERVRSRGAQTLDDLKFTLELFWEYLRGPFVEPPPPLTEGTRAGALPVIIVPGFICRPAIYRRLQAAIHAAGHPCHILDLGFQVGNILRKTQRLSDYITELGASEVLVVGHSMGGVILAASLCQGETRVKRGWTLGAPLWGTNVIWGLYGIGLFSLLVNLIAGVGWDLAFAVVLLSPALRQMLPGSDLVTLVSPTYAEMKEVTSVFCQLDLIAFTKLSEEPGSSSRFRRADDTLFPEAGHNNLAMGDNAIRAIVAALQGEGPVIPSAARELAAAPSLST